MDESILTPPLETNTPLEKATHATHVTMLREFFSVRPLETIEADVLEQLVGRNFQQRISELRQQGFDVDNVPRYRQVGVTKRGLPLLKRATGAYRYRPYVRLAPDAATERSGQQAFGLESINHG